MWPNTKISTGRMMYVCFSVFLIMLLSAVLLGTLADIHYRLEARMNWDLIYRVTHRGPHLVGPRGAHATSTASTWNHGDDEGSLRHHSTANVSVTTATTDGVAEGRLREGSGGDGEPIRVNDVVPEVESSSESTSSLEKPPDPQLLQRAYRYTAGRCDDLLPYSKRNCL